VQPPPAGTNYPLITDALPHFLIFLSMLGIKEIEVDLTTDAFFLCRMFVGSSAFLLLSAHSKRCILKCIIHLLCSSYVKLAWHNASNLTLSVFIEPYAPRVKLLALCFAPLDLATRTRELKSDYQSISRNGSSLKS